MSVLARLADRTPPAAALGVAVLAVSTSAILIRWSEAPSLIQAHYRVLFTLVLLAPWAVTSHRAAFGRLGRGDVVVAVATGIALAIHFAAWFESLRWTSVAASVTLVQLQAVLVAVGAWVLLDERVTRRTGAGILVAVAGVAVMTLPGAELTGPRPLYGNGLALIGAVMMAAYLLVGRSLRQRIPLIPYVVVVYAACVLALFAFALARGHPVGPGAYPSRELLLFLGMAVGPGLFGHTVLNWALEHVDSSAVSVSLLGEPVGSTVLAALLLNEVPGVPTVAGGAVVLLGIFVTVRTREGS